VAWPVYTKTFLQLKQRDVQLVYTVPADSVAVVKSINAVQFEVAGAEVHVRVHGFYIYLARFPATYSALSFATTVVATAGQTVDVMILGAVGHATVSGYLFKNPPGATSDDGEVTQRPVQRPEPLPAEAR
jgi:hypothetical protein